MGAHQLKKLAQGRANNHNHHNGGTHHCIDYVPKHWSVYTLIFSTASLLLFCFLLYDMQSSPTSLVLHASRHMGALKAQVVDSYFFTTQATPSEGVGKDPESETWTEDKQAPKDQGNNAEQSVVLSDEDVQFIQSEFEEPKIPPLTTTTPSEPGENFTPLPKAVLEEVVKEGESEGGQAVITSKTKDSDTFSSASEEDTKQSFSTEEFEDSTSEESVEDADTADSAVVKEDAGALAKQVPSESLATDSTCDWSQGKWIYDESYPLYKPNTCPFIDGGFRCVENGRPSSEFQKWRWQPHGCDLPRFDAKDILERLRDSRMVFVGDSIGRNNWESMLCMLSDVVEDKSRVYEINGETISKHSGFLIYRFEDYNCTVEYYRSPHLVPQGRAPRDSDPKVRSTLKLDIMDWSNSKWSTADIVIFNTGHWWSFEKTVRGGNYFQEKQTVYMNMSVGEAFSRAMRTVARFVEEKMDPSKSQVFFRSYAPVHFKGGTWDHGGHCHNDQKPLQKFPFNWTDKTPSVMIADVMSKNVKNPINFVNITYLSDLRPDGHSSRYQRVPPSPVNHQDCSHWCLPGVPDTWNELVLATLMKNGRGKWGSRTRS